MNIGRGTHCRALPSTPRGTQRAGGKRCWALPNTPRGTHRVGGKRLAGAETRCRPGGCRLSARDASLWTKRSEAETAHLTESSF